jgi:hypothetical protein
MEIVSHFLSTYYPGSSDPSEARMLTLPEILAILENNMVESVKLKHLTKYLAANYTHKMIGGTVYFFM